MARFHGRKGRPWTRVQARVYAEETHCYLCGKYVNQDMANYRHSLARSVHHLIPPDIAPDLANDRANLRLTHLGCNSSYGRGAFKGAPTPGTGMSRVQGRGRRGYRAHTTGRGTGGGNVATKLERDW